MNKYDHVIEVYNKVFLCDFMSYNIKISQGFDYRLYAKASTTYYKSMRLNRWAKKLYRNYEVGG